MRLVQILSVLGALVFNAPAYAAQLELDQARAVELALQNSYEVQIARFGPRIQQERVEQSRGRFDPMLHWEARQHVQDEGGAFGESVKASLGGRTVWGMDYGLNVASDDLFSGTENDYNAHRASVGFTLSQDLLRGFGIEENTVYVRLAQRRQVQSVWRERQDILTLIHQTIVAYNDLFTAQQRLKVAQKSRDWAEQLVENNRKRIAQGTLAEADLSTANATLAQREEQLLLNRLAVIRSANRLKQLLFCEYHKAKATELILPDWLADGEFDAEEESFEAMLESNTRMQLERIALEMARINLRHARNRRLPDLRLSSGVNVSVVDENASAAWSRLREEGAVSGWVGLSMDWPVRNRSARAGEAIAVLEEELAQMRLDQLRLQILFQLDTALNDVRLTYERIALSRRARELSALSLEAAVKRFRAGASTTFQVLRLQKDLASAEAQEVQAMADYHKSRAAFARIKGTLGVE